MPSSNQDASDSDDAFKEDFEALERACRLITIDNHPQSESDGGEYGEDELQFVRSIHERFADDADEPLSLKPLFTLPPDLSDNDDDCDDDYETLRAIHRRFAAYNDGCSVPNADDITCSPLQVGATNVSSEKESSNRFVERTNAREGFLNCVDASKPPVQNSQECDDAGGREFSNLVERNAPGTDDLAVLPHNSSHLPNSALAFVDAIKKNRSCQKLLRSKMMQMEARLEELRKLIDRVKILKDFQLACKKKMGRALSQKKDPRVQLISVPKLRANKKFNSNKIPAACKGPPENMHVANHREAMSTFVASVNQEKWSKEESENLLKGVKQQFQQMLLQRSVDALSEADGSCDSSNVDNIIGSIKDLDVTPEKIRAFLPKVNWEELAAMYVRSHSGAECEARFLNFEDPLINHNPWTAMEDKNLLHIVQQKGLSNWIDIAASLGTNRTPFQCLARYQRSLNASILKREWTKEEDDQLRAAVETFGESNWQFVASVMEGRTGTQCSNRWLKTLHPGRKRVGKWTAEEDKRLKVAVTLFGPKTWKKIASCVPGRTQVQCRERWVNCLDPSLNTALWTKEEDLNLELAIEEHGYCWSKVAACIPHRTDNQCWRRWKTLFPNDVPQLQTARKIQKAALISNFVDRESERPSLGPNDFVLPEIFRITGPEGVGPSLKKKRGSRQRKARELIKMDGPSSESGSEEVLRLTNGNPIENVQGRPRRKGRGRGRDKDRRLTENHCSTSNHLSPSPDTVLTNASLNCEEIPKSPVDNGHCSKNRSSFNSESHDKEGNTVTDVLLVEDYEQFDEAECLLELPVYPHVETETPGGELANKCKRASKLRPRRRQNGEEPNTRANVDKASKQRKKEMGTDKAGKRKRNVEEMEDIYALFDKEYGPGVESRSSKCCEVESSSIFGDASVPNVNVPRRQRSRNGRGGRRNGNEITITRSIEEEDDIDNDDDTTTLGDIYNRLKKRRKQKQEQ